MYNHNVYTSIVIILQHYQIENDEKKTIAALLTVQYAIQHTIIFFIFRTLYIYWYMLKYLK